MNSDQSEIWFSAIHALNLLSVWQIHFEFDHFIATVPISIILISNYRITLQINFKWIPINQKFEFNAINAPNLLSVWQIHFEFDHFIATVPISIILISNYRITLQINFKWIPINQKFEFNAINAPNLLSVWQIHFEFDHFIATGPISIILISNYQITLQLNFKLSVINLKFEFNAINAPNLLSVWEIHFEFEDFIATVPHQSS